MVRCVHRARFQDQLTAALTVALIHSFPRETILCGGLADECLTKLTTVRAIELELGQPHKLTAFVPRAVVMGSTLSICFEGKILKVQCVLRLWNSIGKPLIHEMLLTSHSRTHNLGLVEVIGNVASWPLALPDVWPSFEHDYARQRCFLQFICGSSRSKEIDICILLGLPTPPIHTTRLEIPPINFPSFFGGDLVPQEPVKALLWQHDDAAPNCSGCKASFGFFKRRHHCRWCGRVACASCAPLIQVTCVGSSPQHICGKCRSDSPGLK